MAASPSRTASSHRTATAAGVIGIIGIVSVLAAGCRAADEPRDPADPARNEECVDCDRDRHPTPPDLLAPPRRQTFQDYEAQLSESVGTGLILLSVTCALGWTLANIVSAVF